jgi:hypothetical protein
MLRVRLSAAAVMVCCCAGCLMSPSNRATETDVNEYYFPEKHGSKEQAPTPAGANGATPTPAELSAAMAEVHQLGQSDPAAQQALIEDLRRTEPSLWPQLVHAYRSSLAYRQQSGERIARLARQNGAEGNSILSGNATIASAITPVAATNEIAPQSNAFQNASYPGTSYPSTATPLEQQLPDLSTNSLSLLPRSLPAAADGAILAESPVMTPGGNYPNTNYPEVRLAAAEGYTIVNSETPRYESKPAENTASDNWQAQLAAAIRAMEAKTAASADSSPSVADQATLRMLYLAAGQRDDALRPLTGVSSAEQEFWGKELAGLEKLLGDPEAPDHRQRIAEATVQLQQAVAKLAQSAPLTVRNLAFCTEVNSFGVYKPMPAQTFKPGQQLLLYAEVENFMSEATDKGYRTSLGSRYELLDSRGNRVGEEDFGLTEELCRNARRDFFVRYFLKLPKSLAPGQYTLQLAIEDTAGAKSARGQIQFSVAE